MVILNYMNKGSNFVCRTAVTNKRQWKCIISCDNGVLIYLFSRPMIFMEGRGDRYCSAHLWSVNWGNPSRPINLKYLASKVYSMYEITQKIAVQTFMRKPNKYCIVVLHVHLKCIIYYSLILCDTMFGGWISLVPYFEKNIDYFHETSFT